MGLFDFMPKMPPELMALMANPKALGEQIKAFYVAATRLLAAIENQKKLASDVDAVGTDSLDEADLTVWEAADAFRAELSKLPPLDQVTK